MRVLFSNLITRFAIALASLLIFSHVALAAAPEQLFTSGVQLYQAGKFDEAAQSFEQALDLQPENSLLLYNLGLAQYKKGKVGLAIGLWRRALDLSPRLEDARNALAFALKGLSQQELPHEVTFDEQIRSSFLTGISLDVLLFITLVVLLRSGWVLFRSLGQRKLAIQTNQPLPKWPLSVTLLSVLTVVLLALSVMKTLDYLTPRATVIVEKAPVRTGASEDQASLFDLFEGFEVIVRGVNGLWVQVTYPGGKTGWVMRDTLVPSSGKKPW